MGGIALLFSGNRTRVNYFYIDCASIQNANCPSADERHPGVIVDRDPIRLVAGGVVVALAVVLFVQLSASASLRSLWGARDERWAGNPAGAAFPANLDLDLFAFRQRARLDVGECDPDLQRR